MIKAAVVGGSGYSGAELVKILAGHGEVELSAVTSTSLAGKPISELYPHFTGALDLSFSTYAADLAVDNDVVFLALPHGKAMHLAPGLKAAGSAKIIDISGDFRLPAAVYEAWYKEKHEAPDLVEHAVYGLTELHKDKVSKADIVANPGCYPTGVILAAAPLLAAGRVEGPIVANCISGISGAGRALTEATQFCRAAENVSAYKVGGIHQHIPEIERIFSELTPVAPKMVFTPHLGSFSRGIYTTLTMAAGISGLTALNDLYKEFYAGQDFIKILPAGVYPAVKSVAGSNYCQIGLAVDARAGQVVVMSVIDNLVKGAAGQAVQNMNAMFGLDETAGLMQVGLFP